MQLSKAAGDCVERPFYDGHGEKGLAQSGRLLLEILLPPLNNGATIMARYKVTFRPADVTVEVDPSLYPYGRHGEPGSLLDIALTHGVEIEHACGGVGVCSTCHVIVDDGQANLSSPDDDELDLVEQAPGNTLHSRLACKAVVRGDVAVTIPNWNRNQ